MIGQNQPIQLIILELTLTGLQWYFLHILVSTKCGQCGGGSCFWWHRLTSWGTWKSHPAQSLTTKQWLILFILFDSRLDRRQQSFVKWLTQGATFLMALARKEPFSIPTHKPIRLDLCRLMLLTHSYQRYPWLLPGKTFLSERGYRTVCILPSQVVPTSIKQPRLVHWIL